MNLYIVKVSRLMEWEQYYEADTPELARELALLEAHHGTVIDDQITVEEVQPSEAAVS